MEPSPPRTTSVITLPATLLMCHQVVAATTRAAPRKARPSPSLRCIGSRSAALRPRPRAAKPAACATSIHAAATARAIHSNRIRNPLLAGCGRRGPRPLPRWFPPRPFRAWPLPRAGPRLLLLVRVRGEVPAGRGRVAVLPCGRVPPCDTPPFDPPVLGTRVAMMTTVTSTPGSGRKTRRASRPRLNRSPNGHQPVTAGPGGRSDVHHHRDDHGPAPVVLVHPPADGPPYQLAELAGVADAIGRGGGQRLLDPRDHRAERRVVDPGAPGVDLRRGGQLAGGVVDHHDDRDETLVTEDAPVLQRGLGHLADGQAVHVHVAARDRAGDRGLPVHQVDDQAVLRDHDLVVAHPGQRREPGVRPQARDRTRGPSRCPGARPWPPTWSAR